MALVEVLAIVIVTIIIAFVIHKTLFKNRKSVVDPVVKKILENHENYMRLLTCLNHAGRKICLDVLFTYGYPKDKAEFYKKLSYFRSQLAGGKKKILRDDQINLLFPKNKETDYNKFDITLFYQVIRNCLPHLMPPLGGWNLPKPKSTDKSLSANIIRLKDLRNKLSHGNGKISDDDFEILWNELITLLKEFNYDVNEINALKTCTLITASQYETAFNQSQIELCFDKLEKYNEYGTQIKQCETQAKTNSEGIRGVNRRMSIYETSVQKCQDEFMRSFESLKKEIIVEDREILHANINSIYNSIADIEDKMESGFDSFSQLIKDQETPKNNIDGASTFNHSQERRGLFFGEEQFMDEFNFTNNKQLSVQQLKDVCTEICDSKSYILDSLVLSRCNITDEYLIEIADATPFLRSIDISCNEAITGKGLEAISDVISDGSSRLKSFSAMGCSLQDEDVSKISGLITQMEVLNLSLNKSITSFGYKCLTMAIDRKRAYNELKVLRLSYCALNDESLISITPALLLIKKVFLNHNRNLTEYGYNKLAEVLIEADNYLIEHISLDNCYIGDNRIKAIAKFVPLLKSISLQNNHLITAKGWTYIDEEIKQQGFSYLDSLSIGGTSYSENDFISLTDIILSIRFVIIEDSEVDPAGLQFFVQKLTSAQRNNLTKISFPSTALTVEHLQALLPLFATKVKLNLLQAHIPTGVQIKPFLDKLSADYNEYIFRFCDTGIKWENEQPIYLANMIPKLHCINLMSSFNVSDHARDCIKNSVLDNCYNLPSSLRLWFSNHNKNFLTVIADIGKYFQSINLTYNAFITVSLLNQLVESVCKQKLYILCDLNLKNCNLNDKHVEKLVKIIPTLQELDLSENTRITRHSLNAIANVIASTSPNRFEVLKLRKGGFSFSDLQPLFENKIKLKALHLEGNKSLKANVKFTEPINIDLNLEELNLSDCNLRHFIFPKKCETLCFVKSLTLDNNTGIHVSSLRTLCNNISSSRLEKLSMCGCNLTDEHIEFLSDALSIVKTVDLSNNRAITAQGWTSLLSAIQNSKKQLLKTLIIKDGNLEGTSFSVIFSIAMFLSELTLNDNKLIQQKDFENLNANLQSRQSGKDLTLSLSSCNLGNDHLKYLAPAVPFIKSLNLTENRAINMNGLQYLKDACCSAKYCLTDEIFIDSCNIDQTFYMTMVLPDKCWWWKLTENMPMMDLPKKPIIRVRTDIPALCNQREIKQFLDISGWNDSIWIFNAQTGNVDVFGELIFSENSHLIKGGSLLFWNSQLSDKDLTSLATFAKHLRSLQISGNWLHLESFQELTQSLQVDRCVLEKLVLQNCKLTDDHLKVLEGLLPVVKVMDLNGNKFITPSAWKQFADTYCTKDGVKLESLSLEDCNLTERHIESLRGLIRNLESLSIRNNYTLSSTAYSYLSNIFQTDDCCLENVDIRQSRMTDFHLKRVATTLPQLRSLNFSEVYGFTSSGYESLSSSLKTSRNNYLNECNLSNANVVDEDMAYIGELARWFGKIDLSENKQITVRGFKAFAEAFDKTSVETGVTIKTLLLKDCSLNIFCFVHFENVLSQLTNLHLDSNQNIPLTCLQNISDAMSSSQCCLRYLSLKDCGITRKHLEALSEGIVLLRHVDLSSNIFTVEDCEFLSNLIRTSYPRQIITLYIDNCGIGDKHIEVMAEIIASLRYVSLSNNPSITAEGLSKLSDKFVMHQNIVLEKLYLKNCHLTKRHLMALKNVLPNIKKMVLMEIIPDALVGIPTAVGSCDDLILEEVEFHNIGDAVIEDLLPLVCQLKKLDMSSWSKTFSPSSFDSLATKISQASMMTLESLTLSGCFLVEDMASSLSKFAYKLKKLDMSNCQTLSPQMMKILSDSYVAAKERRLESLKLRNMNLKKTHIDASCELLLQMKELDISENRTITPECFSIISEKMKSSSVKINIKKLVVNQCNLKEAHLKELSLVATRIPFISLNQNKMMSFDGLKNFASRMSQATVPCLERLSFRGCRLTERHVQSISEIVPILKEVDISENKALQKRGLKYISNVLEKSNESKMEKIKFEQCNLNSENLEALQGVINNVKHLSLKYNYNWKVVDITNLVKMISEAPVRSLQVLDLTQCNLKDSHLIALCEVVIYLKELTINKNRLFTKDGFDALSSAIVNNNHLEKLSIAKCHLNDAHFISIAKAVPYLKEIDMSKNPLLSVCGLKEITQSISDVDDNKLEVIHLRDCNLNDDCLLEILRISVTLKKLIISRNRNLSNENFEHFLDDYKQIWNGNAKPGEKLDLDVTDSFIRKSFLTKTRWKDCVNIITDT